MPSRTPVWLCGVRGDAPTARRGRNSALERSAATLKGSGPFGTGTMALDRSSKVARACSRSCQKLWMLSTEGWGGAGVAAIAGARDDTRRCAQGWRREGAWPPNDAWTDPR